MKKFKVVATRIDEYIIEFDETIINDEWIKGFESYMFEVNGLTGLAEHLAWNQLRQGSDGSGRFIEGFGPVTRNGHLPFSRNDYDANGKELPVEKREKPAPGVNIILVKEDDDHEFEVTEIVEETQG